MKTCLVPLILVCFVAVPANAATKTLTVLGGTKIKAVYDGNLPKTAESNGVRTDVSGFVLDEGKLVRALGFEFKSDATI
jgi:hypothetical protein